MSSSIVSPFPTFNDLDGTPLENGYIYIGTANLNPETSPISVFWDSALTIPAAQPIRTISGYASRNGSPANVYVSPSTFSITVRNVNKVFVYSAANVGVVEAFEGYPITRDQIDLPLLGTDTSFVQAGTGAVTLTMQGKVRERVSVKDFGAVGDGIANDTAAVQAAVVAVASSGAQIYFPAGTYKITSVISTTGHLNIIGDGEKTVLDFSTVTSGSEGITVTGSLAQIQNVTSANQDNLTVTFASTPSLAVSDVFCLFDDSVLWNPARAYYYAGEWLECRGVSGLNAQTTNPLYDSYTPATVKAYKLSSPKVSFRNFKINGGANIFGLIKVSLCDKPVFENIFAYNENYECVYIDRCYRPMVTNCVMYNKGTGTLDDYGLVIGNSQKVQVSGGDYYGRRHAIAIGGGDNTCSVTNRNLRISNLTLSNDILSAVASADMHGNIEDLVYQGCMIYQGAAWAGKNNGYDNCTIYSALGGWCIYSSEVLGGNLFVKNSKLHTVVDPYSISRGIVDIGGNSINAINADTLENVNIIIENCELFGRNLSSNTQFVVFYNRGASVYVNIFINGVVADVNDLDIILLTASSTPTANSNAIVVDNVYNFPSTAYLHYPFQPSGGGTYANVPQRMMRQSGSLNMTAASGTDSTIALPISYRYIYPRTPQASFSIGGALGFSNSAGENVGVTGYSVTASAIRPTLVSTSNANWTVSFTATANWSVGIEEI
jgi:hypothetical protein